MLDNFKNQISANFSVGIDQPSFSTMQETRPELTTIRDLKPSMKNLNMIFIVLEIGTFGFQNIFKSTTVIFKLCLQVGQMLQKMGMK